MGIKNKSNNAVATVKVYQGYGHQHDLTVYGHVLAGSVAYSSTFSNSIWRNTLRLIRLFMVKPVPGVPVRLQWNAQQFHTTTETDGFFKFEWASAESVPAGWHGVSVDLLDAAGNVLVSGAGEVFVPHITQYAFISDIDDTVLISYSARPGKKLGVMFSKNPRSRKTFADIVRYYDLLALAHTEPDVPNPFFYVSSSEWNLYDDLHTFFEHNRLPNGAFLLSQIKRWYQLLSSGGTKHQTKLMRIARILHAFPKQRFVLLGDNSQSDPEIYTAIANKYPDNITAVYLRNIRPEKEPATRAMLARIESGEIECCVFNHTEEAMEHSRRIGLIG